MYARFVARATPAEPIEPPPVPASHRNDAWPGGWRSRPQPASRQGAQAAVAASISATPAGRVTTPRIGLALSGGGFRATCFGLGCLRALHDQDLLRHVSVISGISGGSVLAALYAYGPAEFDEFDALVVEQLRRGLQLEIVARALRPAAASAQPRSRHARGPHPAGRRAGAPRRQPNRCAHMTLWPLELSVTACSTRSPTPAWRP